MLPLESKKPRNSPRLFRRPDVSSPLKINDRLQRQKSQAGSTIFPDMEPNNASKVGVGDLGDENQSLSASPKSRRKLPWRLRWPDDFRDEVLARLLELNEQRHKQELLAGSSQLSAKKETKATKKTAKSTKATPGQALPGFDDVDG